MKWPRRLRLEKLYLCYIYSFPFMIKRINKPDAKPISDGTSHPRFKSKKGKILRAKPTTFSAYNTPCKFSGDVLIKSNIAAIKVKPITLL